MKRTDEMKLGKQLSDAANEAPDLYVDLVKTGQWVGRIERKIGMPPEMAAPYGPPPTTEYPSDRRTDPIERFSIAAQLQLMKALAILGWAAFILELLGV